jgi:hypothetical protein
VNSKGDRHTKGWYEVAVADQLVVVRKPVKVGGAKGLACSGLWFTTTPHVRGKIPDHEPASQPVKGRYILDVNITFVMEQEELDESRGSRPVVRPDKVDISNGCKSHQSKSQRSVAK